MKVKVIVVVVGVLACAVAWVGNDAAEKMSPSQEKAPQNAYPSQSSNSTSAPPVATTPMPEPGTQAGGGSAVPPVTLTGGTSEQFPLPTPPRTIVRDGEQLADPRLLEKQTGAKDLLGEPAPGQSNDNPTGRQEPAVSLEWIGPATCKI